MKRKIHINFEEYTDSSDTDDDNLMISGNIKHNNIEHPLLPGLENRQGSCVQLEREQRLLEPKRQNSDILQVDDGDEEGNNNDQKGDDGDEEGNNNGQKGDGRQRYYLRSARDIHRHSIDKNKEMPRPLNKLSSNPGIRTKVGKNRGKRDQSKFRKCHYEGSDDDATLSQIQPIQINESLSFDDVGGLSKYIEELKNMVFLPLLYPELFQSYCISPSRGVLLCGPPGTGKTLIARALACAASKVGQKVVNFYMRKGADVMSKWVGEAEKNLKLLFEEAQKNQPSIIFFDEIDGLAPARSSKQDQIHNSVVSTLLALMDGLDSRGQVVLIGATNRVDEIDGALRRPGRFDRELCFPLPDFEARVEILDIHTRKWKQPPSKPLKLELSTTCVGYCGADLKALCDEAVLLAFRDKYPQVYIGQDKCLIDVDSVKVEKSHFIEAMSIITPASRRPSTVVNSRPLSPIVFPCLQRHLQQVIAAISKIFPFRSVRRLVHRPKLLLVGDEGIGLDHIGLAALHELEKFPVHSLALQSLFSYVGDKPPEIALEHVFREAKRTTPSVLYLPQFHLWWESVHDRLRTLLRLYLDELPFGVPILLLGTSSIPLAEICDNPTSVFSDCNVMHVSLPSIQDRSLFYDCLIEAALQVPYENSLRLKDVVKASKAPELRDKTEVQGLTLRRLRMHLRDVCNRILNNKYYSAFHSSELNRDNPTGMAMLLQRVDNGKYSTCESFLEDFDIIITNAKKLHEDDYRGARIVSRAYELRDVVHDMLYSTYPYLVELRENKTVAGGMETSRDNAHQQSEEVERPNKHIEIGGEISRQVYLIKQLLLERTKDYGIPQLEWLYTHLINGVSELKNRADDKTCILSYLFEFASNPSTY